VDITTTRTIAIMLLITTAITEVAIMTAIMLLIMAAIIMTRMDRMIRIIMTAITESRKIIYGNFF
jgi:hypothetical protein